MGELVVEELPDFTTGDLLDTLITCGLPELLPDTPVMNKVVKGDDVYLKGYDGDMGCVTPAGKGRGVTD